MRPEIDDLDETLCSTVPIQYQSYRLGSEQGQADEMRLFRLENWKQRDRGAFASAFRFGFSGHWHASVIAPRDRIACKLQDTHPSERK